MKIPIGLRIVTVIISVTACYGYVGQMFPQMEVHPPRIVEVAEDVGVEEMVRIGKEIFEGRGTCTLCHTMGSASDSPRFPDLEGIGARAEGRVAGLDSVAYLTQALYEPNAYIVEGFSPGMPAVDKPPIGLTDDEVLAVVAFLQSQGGEPTVTMKTALRIAGNGASGNGASGNGASGNGASGIGAAAVPAAATAKSPEASPPVLAEAAAGPGPASAAIENGRAIYHRTCVICHGDRAQGNEMLNAPKLAGQESWYISRQLKNFAAGLRGGDPQDVFGAQMRPMAMTLGGDQEIEDVAAYLSSLTPTAAPGP